MDAAGVKASTPKHGCWPGTSLDGRLPSLAVATLEQPPDPEKELVMTGVAIGICGLHWAVRVRFS